MMHLQYRPPLHHPLCSIRSTTQFLLTRVHAYHTIISKLTKAFPLN
ncbi:hypothetical protein MtrunA17_Chr4g0073481 [Medicago truncatula]|uniref:Uncharacterized protein n=1 Tax=Medicago truncatula TaxID=3880 RepID=A0A396IJJ5_MEDTR|nr:hypothetical protein MtrunA17_Chr4g0073481 [Medicago truncatula]